MDRKIVYIALAAALLFGCQKKDASNPVPEQDAPVAQADANGGKVDENAVPVEPTKVVVDFKSNETPDIVTRVDTTDTAWGKIQKTSVTWHDDLDISYEIPVLKGDSEAIKKINAEMKKRLDMFLTKENLSGVWEYERGRHLEDLEPSEEIYMNAHKVDVAIYKEKYFSVTQSYEWYMGGVMDYGKVPTVFNLETGDVVTLEQLTGKSTDELRKIITESIQAQYKEVIDAIEWDRLQDYKGFKYYIKDGIVTVAFVKYEIAIGAAGGIEVILPIAL